MKYLEYLAFWKISESVYLIEFEEVLEDGSVQFCSFQRFFMFQIYASGMAKDDSDRFGDFIMGVN